MTKPLAVAALLVLAVAASIAGASTTLEGPALIRVSQRLVSEHELEARGVTTAFIRDRKARRIGWSVLLCTPLGRGEVLGSGSEGCSATYSFPLGRIQAAGVRKTAAPSYVLAVTGGTGFYSAAGGTLLVRGVGSSVELLLFSLE